MSFAHLPCQQYLLANQNQKTDNLTKGFGVTPAFIETSPTVFALINEDKERVPVVAGNISTSNSPIVGRYAPLSYDFEITGITSNSRYNDEFGTCPAGFSGKLTLPPYRYFGSNKLTSIDTTYYSSIRVSDLYVPLYTHGNQGGKTHIASVLIYFTATVNGIYATIIFNPTLSFNSSSPPYEEYSFSWTKKIGDPIIENGFYDSDINGYSEFTIDFTSDDADFVITEDDGCPGTVNTLCDFSNATITVTAKNDDIYRSTKLSYDLNEQNWCDGDISTTLICKTSNLSDNEKGFGSCNNFNNLNIPLYNYSMSNDPKTESWDYTFQQYTNKKDNTGSKIKPFDCFCNERVSTGFNGGACIEHIRLTLDSYQELSDPFSYEGGFPQQYINFYELGPGDTWSDVVISGTIELYRNHTYEGDDPYNGTVDSDWFSQADYTVVLEEFPTTSRNLVLKYQKRLCQGVDCYELINPFSCTSYASYSNARTFVNSVWSCTNLIDSLNGDWELVENNLNSDYDYCNWSNLDFNFEAPATTYDWPIFTQNQDLFNHSASYETYNTFFDENLFTGDVTVNYYGWNGTSFGILGSWTLSWPDYTYIMKEDDQGIQYAQLFFPTLTVGAEDAAVRFGSYYKLKNYDNKCTTNTFQPIKPSPPSNFSAFAGYTTETGDMPGRISSFDYDYFSYWSYNVLSMFEIEWDCSRVSSYGILYDGLDAADNVNFQGFI